MNTVARGGVVMLLAILVSAGQFRTAAEPLDSLAAVRSQIRIGAEIFLDPSYTREEIPMHFRADEGVRIDRGPAVCQVGPRRTPAGQWRFDLYDHAYDAAAANGMSVLTILCPEDPPGWVRQTVFYHSKSPLNTPELRKRGAEYARRVVLRHHTSWRPVFGANF